MSKDLSANDPPSFFSEIREILQQARGQAAKAVNTAMVQAYWQVGKRIVDEEQEGAVKAEYGKRILEELSKNLTHEFGRGFSLANLRNMRQFYLSCPDQGIRYTLCSELSWSHNRLIMREEDESARLHYLEQSKANNWSVRELQRQLKTQSYRRRLSSQAPTNPPTKTSQLLQLNTFKYRTVLPTEEQLKTEIERKLLD